MPKLSIIIPVYNAEHYLKECLESIKNQTYRDLEVLLIDDGSTDKSGAICDKYSKMDNRFRVFHKNNEGVSSARNIGLDNARGEWIAFVDSDDYLASNNSYEKIFKSNLDDIDLIYFGFITEKGTSFSKYISESLTFNEYDNCIEKKDLLKSIDAFIFVWNVIIKKNKLNGLRFENLKCQEDGLFIQSFLLNVTKAKIINDYFYYYRNDNTSSVTNKFIPYSFPNILYHQSKLKSLYIKESFYDEESFNELFIKYFWGSIMNVSAFKNYSFAIKLIKEYDRKIGISNLIKWNMVFSKNKMKFSYLIMKLKLYRFVIILKKMKDKLKS